MSPLAVSDTRSNFPEQLVHAAETLGRSKKRAKVFHAIYFGKKAVKTVSDLRKVTGLSHKDVLTAGKALADHHIVDQVKVGRETGYRKDATYARHYRRILRLAEDPKKRAQIPTKRNSGGKSSSATAQFRVPRSQIDAVFVTVDDIDSFSKVLMVESTGFVKIPEARFKKGVQAIIGETGVFKDWGGEKNDLWSTRLRLDGKRRRCAFAFKGPGTTGKLTPKKLGKNGDQIQRLFATDADVYIVQYWGAIDETVLAQMSTSAQLKSVVEGRRIYYGIIDGDDSARIITGYSQHFSRKTA